MGLAGGRALTALSISARMPVASGGDDRTPRLSQVFLTLSFFFSA